MLLITGANGRLGRLIVEEVLRRNPTGDVAVSVRDPARATDLAQRGVEVRGADYNAPETLRAAFTGVDRLLLMPTPTLDPDQRSAQHRVAIQCAVASGVGHVVYASVFRADSFGEPLLATHRHTEIAIQDSGAQWTILRNAIYAEVLAGDVAAAVRSGQLAVPAADAAVAPVLRRDLAVATAITLLDDGYQQRIFELTAPDTVSWHQLAQLATIRSGRPIPYRPISDDVAIQRGRADGIPPQQLDILIGFYRAYRQGWCATPSPDFEALTGPPATGALEAVKAVLDGTAS